MYRLYWCPETAAMAPQGVLAEAGQPCQLELVDIGKGDNRTPDYLALNPNGYVPALVDGDGPVIYESAAIVLYLCDRHPEAGLAPAPDDPLRGLFLRGLFHLVSEVQGAYKRHYYPDRFSSRAGDAPRIREQADADLLRTWGIVESNLAGRGPYMLGERYSAADIYLVMLASWYEPSTEPLFAACPNVARCFRLTAARPALQPVLEAHGITGGGPAAD